MASLTVFTIGHSTRTVAQLVELLRAHAVTKLVDVRTVPRSRHTPQFNLETLPQELKAAGIGYLHLAGLGGLRHAHKESINTGWRSASFRGYADYMLTPQFEENLNALIELAGREGIAIMSAEAVPWRCHRSLISDALTVRGIRVEHIMSPSRSDLHAITPWAQVEGTRITYPSQQQSALPIDPRPTEQGDTQAR